MASPKSTPPLFLHLHEFAAETVAAMHALELRTIHIALANTTQIRTEKTHAAV